MSRHPFMWHSSALRVALSAAFFGSNEESLNATIWTTSLPRIPEDFASYEGLEVSDKAVAATFAISFAFLLWPENG